MARAAAPKKNAAAAAKAAETTTTTTRNYVSEAMAKRVLEHARTSHADVVGDATARQTQCILECFLQQIVKEALAGNTTTIANFATFSRALVNEHTYKNPQTNEPIVKPAHYKMQVRIMPAMKAAFEAVPIEGNK